MQRNDGNRCPPIKPGSGSPFLDTAAPIGSVVVAGYAFWRDLPPLNEAVQRVLGGPFANSAPSGGADAATPEKRPVEENTERNQTRPGVIRTHDQGIMSADDGVE